MTESAAVEKLLTWLRSQIGYHEGAGNQNKYADIVQKAIGWYAQGQPWCSIFVIAAMVECFGLEMACAMLCTAPGLASAACRANADCFKAAGRFSRFPRVGDQIFFYYSGDINHTGIVEKISGNKITTIEGNSSDRVRRNTYSASDPIIAGYGSPRWELLAEEKTEETEENGNEEKPVINDTEAHPITEVKNMAALVPLLTLAVKDEKREDVKAFQALFNIRFSGELKINGYYDEKTEAACRYVQEAYGIDIDGECGRDTWAALIRGN